MLKVVIKKTLKSVWFVEIQKSVYCRTSTVPKLSEEFDYPNPKCILFTLYYKFLFTKNYRIDKIITKSNLLANKNLFFRQLRHFLSQFHFSKP
ncbi:hypothetical protein B0E43_21870 [Algoriphagus sp. A40]|nr:hypothetical protein B0E43_21870 [Algoriphagus sp. A40]